MLTSPSQVPTKRTVGTQVRVELCVLSRRDDSNVIVHSSIDAVDVLALSRRQSLRSVYSLAVNQLVFCGTEWLPAVAVSGLR